MKTVIITGSRAYSDYKKLSRLLGIEFDQSPFIHLVQGGARGADSLAARWADDHNMKVTTVEAQWDLYGKSAGMRRNREMLDTFPDARVIAFPIGESRGTRGCIAEAKKRGMEVTVYEDGPEPVPVKCPWCKRASAKGNFHFSHCPTQIHQS